MKVMATVSDSEHSFKNSPFFFSCRGPGWSFLWVLLSLPACDSALSQASLTSHSLIPGHPAHTEV